MGLRRNRKPESVLDELVSRQQNTLGVFEVVASSLESIAAEAERVREESEVEARRHNLVVAVADQQAQDAKVRAKRIRELFA